MPLPKFCKIVAVLILLFFWLPVVLSLLWKAAVMSEIEHVFGLTGAELSADSYKNHDNIAALILGSFILGYLVLLPGLSIWLCFPKNPLEKLFLWLAEDRNTVSLTTIIVRTPVIQVSASHQPELSTGPKQEEDTPYRNPDDKYLPPEYRVGK